MSESDMEFVADMEWLHSHDREAALPPDKLTRLFALARRGAEKDAVVAFLGQFQKLSEELSRLRIQNIQMQAALGYAICAEDERHIIPSNPFKCGVCDAHNRAVKDTPRPPPEGEK